MIILKSNFSSTSSAGKLIGGFMVAIWDVGVYSHVLSSINRLVVITCPIRSRNMFSQRNNLIMIAIVWFLGFVHFLPYLKMDECYVVFFSTSYLWTFSSNTCGFILGKVLDFGTGVTVFIIVVVCDAITLWRIRHTMMQLNERRSHHGELKLFAQSCIQFSIFVVKLTNFYFISGYFAVDPVKYHWPLFFTTTFVWEFTHCIDGLIVILFQYNGMADNRKAISKSARISTMRDQ
ncbi:hypothetical protein DICVIV_02878 [Dictyocaulus viviparus]|uniref:G-protein coupled receptors family 1 profile domain-containing protein n=1 Tax=Dictyocaulus viviparus TaxID=29172 RepID=A0A0D8Y404_DICVI|nr:hypothetical protein DICVIV_02878 [Dictyocaulus viviparus]